MATTERERVIKCKRSAELARRRIASGNCQRCGLKNDSGRKNYCDDCKAKCRERVKDNNTYFLCIGLCPKCKNRKKGNAKWCDECSKKRLNSRKRINGRYSKGHYDYNFAYNSDQRKFKKILSFLSRIENVSNQVESMMKDSLEKDKAAIAGMDTEALKAEFAEGLRMTKDRLLRLGLILVELESRGETVDGDKFLVKMLRRIGSGDLSVDAVVRFAGRPYTLQSLAKVPREVQDEILKMSDDEVDNKCRRPCKRSPDGIVDGYRHSTPKEGPKRSSLEDSVKFASPGDVADLCMGLILASEDPFASAQALAPKLKTVAKKKPSMAM